MEELAAILDEDGYLTSVAALGPGRFRIDEHNCAITAVARRYGQACSSELDFIQQVLPEAEVRRVHHMNAGDRSCGYEIVGRPQSAWRAPGLQKCEVFPGFCCARQFEVAYWCSSPSMLCRLCAGGCPPVGSVWFGSPRWSGKRATTPVGGGGRSVLVADVVGVCASRFGVGASLEWGRLDGSGLRAAAQELQRAIGALQHHQRVVLGLIDDRRAFAAEGSRDAADWAAGKLGMSTPRGHEQLEVVASCRSSRPWPRRRRRGSCPRSRPRRWWSWPNRPATDAAWASAAPETGVATLRRRAGRARRPGAADHVAARAVRTFDAWTAGQELRFKGSVPVDDGARLLKAIERSMPARDPEAPATLGQRQADGLFALASQRVAADADPDRATVVVIAELAAICDDDPASDRGVGDR